LACCFFFEQAPKSLWEQESKPFFEPMTAPFHLTHRGMQYRSKGEKNGKKRKKGFDYMYDYVLYAWVLLKRCLITFAHSTSVCWRKRKETLLELCSSFFPSNNSRPPNKKERAVHLRSKFKKIVFDLLLTEILPLFLSYSTSFFRFGCDAFSGRN